VFKSFYIIKRKKKIGKTQPQGLKINFPKILYETLKQKMEEKATDALEMAA